MCLFVPQGAPKPVAMEPCSGGKAAVLTVLLHLPSGPSGLPPPGQSGQSADLGPRLSVLMLSVGNVRVEEAFKGVNELHFACSFRTDCR